MAGSPYVSVVVDTYNYGRYIVQAIESVLAQTLSGGDCEVIVVDDGSVDDTPSIVAKYRDRVRYIRKENGGQASAFNMGVAASRGELVCFLDADDYFYSRKLEQVAAYFSRCPHVGVVYNRYDVVDESGTTMISGVPSKVAEGNVAGRTLLGYSSGCPSSGISVRRELVRRTRIPEESFRIAADHFYVSIFPLLTQVGFLSETLHAYRVHGRNLFLGQNGAERLAIHARQKEALWSYASKELGREFFRTEDDFQGRLDSPKKRLTTYAAGLRCIAKTDAPAFLRLWASCKLTARLFMPPAMFGSLKAFKARLLRTERSFWR